MPPVSIFSSIASSGTTSSDLSRVVLRLRSVASKYKISSLTMRLLISQLSLVSASLEKLEITVLPSSDQVDFLAADIDATTQGCQDLLSLLDSHLKPLERRNISAEGSASPMEFLWSEAEVEACLRFLDRQVNALTLYITVSKCDTREQSQSLATSESGRDIRRLAKEGFGSILDSASVDAGSSIGGVLLPDNQSFLSRHFAFDDEILQSPIYGRVVHSNLAQNLPPQSEANIPSSPSEDVNPSAVRRQAYLEDQAYNDHGDMRARASHVSQSAVGALTALRKVREVPVEPISLRSLALERIESLAMEPVELPATMPVELPAWEPASVPASDMNKNTTHRAQHRLSSSVSSTDSSLENADLGSVDYTHPKSEQGEGPAKLISVTERSLGRVVNVDALPPIPPLSRIISFSSTRRDLGSLLRTLVPLVPSTRNALIDFVMRRIIDRLVYVLGVLPATLYLETVPRSAHRQPFRNPIYALLIWQRGDLGTANAPATRRDIFSLCQVLVLCQQFRTAASATLAKSVDVAYFADQNARVSKDDWTPSASDLEHVLDGSLQVHCEYDNTASKWASLSVIACCETLHTKSNVRRLHQGVSAVIIDASFVADLFDESGHSEAFASRPQVLDHELLRRNIFRSLAVRATGGLAWQNSVAFVVVYGELELMRAASRYSDDFFAAFLNEYSFIRYVENVLMEVANESNQSSKPAERR